MSPTTSSIGAALRARRRALGLTQQDVADLAGSTQRTVSEIENGKPGRTEVLTAVLAAVGLVLVAVAHDDPIASGSR